MARVICKTVYTYEELSDSAKEKALYEGRSTLDYSWADENKETLEAFCRIFPVKVRDWEYGGYGRHISHYLTCDDDIAGLSGLRLHKYLWNNFRSSLFKGKYYSKAGKSRHSRIILEACCVLTGYCVDDDILQPVYDFLKKPNNRTTFEDLMGDCLEAWLSSCDADFEAYFSEESMADIFAANDYEFYEDGTFA